METINIGDEVLYVPTETRGVVSELMDDLACVRFAGMADRKCAWVPLESLRLVGTR